MRSQWIDKVNGRVINLNNYSFSEMSGWNGYLYDWTNGWTTDKLSELTKTTAGNRVTFTGIENFSSKQINFYYRFMNANSVVRLRLRISGMKSGETLGISVKYSLEDVNYSSLLRTAENGYLEVDVPTCDIFLMAFDGIEDKTDRTFTIEQLPLYPGALVSDGIDDRIRAEEAFGKVGTVLIHWKNIGLPVGRYLYNTGWENDAGRLYCWNTQGNIACGIPHMHMDGHPIMIYHRSPLVSTVPLNNNPGENTCPIFRLIFIKEQLDEAQQEFLKWKVEKEYRDWCRANGYDYAIPEMTSATN